MIGPNEITYLEGDASTALISLAIQTYCVALSAFCQRNWQEMRCAAAARGAAARGAVGPAAPAWRSAAPPQRGEGRGLLWDQSYKDRPSLNFLLCFSQERVIAPVAILRISHERVGALHWRV